MKLKSFKLSKQFYQHVDLSKTNRTQFERVKSDLKQIYYEQNTLNDNYVIMRKRNLPKPNRNTLLNRENVFCASLQGPRVKLSRIPGSL